MLAKLIKKKRDKSVVLGMKKWHESGITEMKPIKRKYKKCNAKFKDMDEMNKKRLSTDK